MPVAVGTSLPVATGSHRLLHNVSKAQCADDTSVSITGLLCLGGILQYLAEGCLPPSSLHHYQTLCRNGETDLQVFVWVEVHVAVLAMKDLLQSAHTAEASAMLKGFRCCCQSATCSLKTDSCIQACAARTQAIVGKPVHCITGHLTDTQQAWRMCYDIRAPSSPMHRACGVAISHAYHNADWSALSHQDY